MSPDTHGKTLAILRKLCPSWKHIPKLQNLKYVGMNIIIVKIADAINTMATNDTQDMRHKQLFHVPGPGNHRKPLLFKVGPEEWVGIYKVSKMKNGKRRSIYKGTDLVWMVPILLHVVVVCSMWGRAMIVSREVGERPRKPASSMGIISLQEKKNM